MKNPLNITLFLLLIMISIQLNAQEYPVKKDLSGSWLGTLRAGAIDLRIVFNLSYHENDSLSATMDSPDQNAKNIPLGRIRLKQDSVMIEAPLLVGYYRGRIKNDTSITGTWTQRGQAFPLDLRKLETRFEVKRPQEPLPPFPYKSEEVTFPNRKFNIYLTGTLTIPEGEGPFPAVVLITGSGAQNRDEAIMGHKPFLVIADWLTRNGIAVLRYDDRGVGKSQGKYAEATSADLATDAEAALIYLHSLPEINHSATGLAGHSEGSLIAAIVASRNPGVSFVISLAGTGIRGDEILFRQQADIGRLSGATEEDLEEAIATNKKLFSIVTKEKDNIKAEKKVFDTYSKMLAGKNLQENEKEAAMAQLRASFGAPTYTWFRYFLITDPSMFWKKVSCPVLALNGEKDTQVAAVINLAAIEKALISGGNRNVRTVSMPGLNHLFQQCSTGAPSEYGKIEETFSTEALDIISGWILNLKVKN